MDRVIVALDFDSEAAACQLVDRLGTAASAYKIGMQLLTSVGPGFVPELIGRGKDVFLDLKLHEIPNSVAGAVAAAGELGACMVTVHALGGSAVLRAAVDAARPYPNLNVLGLTVITSMREADLREVGIDSTVDDQVKRLAVLAEGSGCDGVVASPREAHLLRASLSPETLIVTPGIRMLQDDRNDQARSQSPSVAAASGATHLVVGRSIAKASDPISALQAIRDDLRRAGSV